MYHRKTREIVLAEGRLETGWWGPRPEAAPTLVLLHEGLGSLGLWKQFPAHLAQGTGCGVFAWSRFGYGHSDPVSLPRPLDYMQREAREVLPRLLDAIGVRRFVLVGHSDGGSIAAIYAGSFQNAALAGLVLLAPHFFTEPMGLAAIAEAKWRYEEGDLRARLARHHRDVDNAFRGWNGAWLDPLFPETFDLLPDIIHIRVPVLAIQGGADPYGTEEQLRVLGREAYCPVEVRMIPGIGHAPHAEAEQAVIAAVRDFAGRLLGVGIPEK